MTSAFSYRPKFVDIRVNKPEPDPAPREPEERPCDHIGCGAAGRHKAPKGRDQNGFWWFCQAHAADYNRRWNYFQGMSDDDVEAFFKAEEGGHRPTWTFRASRNDRLSAAMRAFAGGKRRDPFGVFGGEGAAARPVRQPKFSRLQVLAFEALALEPGAGGAAVRARYAELVKRYHPDSNGGDRSAEAQLEKVVKAYQLLKAGGLT